MMYIGPPQEVPLAVLGKPFFNYTGRKIAYTPNSTMAKEIMDKIEKKSILKGISVFSFNAE